jgi:hypothetical protein
MILNEGAIQDHGTTSRGGVDHPTLSPFIAKEGHTVQSEILNLREEKDTAIDTHTSAVIVIQRSITKVLDREIINLERER